MMAVPSYIKQYEAGELLTIKGLSQLADDWDLMREKRLALQKEVDKLKETETKLKNILTHCLQKQTNAIGGKRGTASLTRKQEPTIEDWAPLYAHIRKTGEFDLLYRRINPLSVKERWENKLIVPGVQSIEVLNISWSKAK